MSNHHSIFNYINNILFTTKTTTTTTNTNTTTIV